MTVISPSGSDSKSPDPALTYIGRFAPSPTGPLHMGSLIAALASYLDARAQRGHWLVRMEDLDPPREPAGAADIILAQLDALGLHWDGSVLYQSQRQDAYEEALRELQHSDLCFACDCSRQRLRALNSVYDGHCREHKPEPGKKTALRIKILPERFTFIDRIQGEYSQQLADDVGDFVIKRKDGLFAYQLAVVVDDAFQQITDIVRGYDLLDSTPRQLYLQQCLKLATPRYAHIPVIVNNKGQKLSKQHFATPIDAQNGPFLLHEALKFLGQRPDKKLCQASCTELLQWGVEHWDIQAVPKLANIPEVAS